MVKGGRVTRVVLRVLLALLFVVSAVAKLFGIDDFELYIFSYGFFPLNFCFIAARLCIGAELALAVLIAMGVWRRWVNMSALLLLTAFSLFLCYAILAGRNDSCQCFGRLADMPPSTSLLKNAVLVVLVLYYSAISSVTQAVRQSTAKTLVCAFLVLVSFTVPFVVSVPDNWMYGPAEARFDKEVFAEAIGEGGGLAEYHIGEGRRLVAFVTPGCPYCRMTRQKLNGIAERHRIDAENMVFLEPEQIGMGLFLGITHGMRPLVMLVDGGEVKTTYHYRNISERQVADFLTASVDK